MKRKAFTLVEVLIVVVIMAVLAATIIPQFTNSTDDAKVSSAQFNLHTLRQQIQLFRSQHDGVFPAALGDLALKTDADGNVGAGAEHVYGPYVMEIPVNPWTGNATITAVSSEPIGSGDVTSDGGWLYNAATGELRVDHADHVDK